jgi:protein-tyrosine phosphatase
VIDLHCHLLHGVDDGSRNLEQSLRTLNLMRENGTTAVCLTPHFSVGRIAKGLPPTHDRAFAELRASAPEGIALHRGVELLLDRPVRNELLEHPELTLGGTRYVLVEFTRLAASSSITNALRQILQLDLVPVLAHPERYQACSPRAVRQWKADGALMQVDATTLLSGRGRGQRARMLLSHGLADILAADNHGDARLLKTASEYLTEHGGSEQADLLTRLNPAAILANGEVEPAPPLEIKTPWIDRLKTILGGDEE